MTLQVAITAGTAVFRFLQTNVSGTDYLALKCDLSWCDIFMLCLTINDFNHKNLQMFFERLFQRTFIDCCG